MTKLTHQELITTNPAYRELYETYGEYVNLKTANEIAHKHNTTVNKMTQDSGLARTPFGYRTIDIVNILTK